MGFRPIDLRCGCGCATEELVWVPYGKERPRTVERFCQACQRFTDHETEIGLPAPYMGERILNPQMFGGQYDTMGAREQMPLPELPGAAEHSALMRKRLAQLPDNASNAEKREAFTVACKDAPSSADYASHFQRPEWKETAATNEVIAQENKQKRQRAGAIAKGENINMRRDKCAGDPNITA